MIAVLQDLLNALKLNIPAELFVVIQLVLGLVLMFFGQKAIRVWLALTGMLGGAYIANLAIERFDLGNTESLVIYLIFIVAGAAILATAYKACFFIAGFIAGYYLSQYILGVFMPEASFYINIIVGIVVAFLSLLAQKKFEIYATGITGAMLTVDAAVSYIMKTSPGDLLNRVPNLNIKITDDLIILLAIAILAGVGILYQEKQHKKRS